MSANGISKSYGIDGVLENVSFSVDKGDRIGIVGPNGAGKTTLLGIIAGETAPSSGSVYVRNECSLGYLKQSGHFDAKGTVIEEAEKSFEHLFRMEKEIEGLTAAISDHTSANFDRNLEKYTALMEEFEKAGGYTFKSELGAVLRHMGFNEEMQQKKVETLSGGERTRLALACMLLKKPDILLLDEPTNHLDIRAITWLAQHLKHRWKPGQGAMLVVTHDRWFLDEVCLDMWEVHDCMVEPFEGGYSAYIMQRVERDRQAALAEQKRQNLLRRELAWMSRGARARATKPK
ncbi:MAG: ABC-F family ATP-binding cassette domain-containing protein, partial [Mogibacterium sp.]|nr:ABC-F family ATP-binding cassette domain-containing protein [Mogibacterium sp.]